MKKIFIAICLLVASACVCVACTEKVEVGQFLRIHIRANSNLVEDQNVKYRVKDAIVEYLTPYISECESYSDVLNVINLKKETIENVANAVLVKEGFDYKSNIEINNEYFPTRTYQSCTLPADYYDAIIVNLGNGVGDNWWCVVYPPLCFKDTKNVVYKSKILELVNKYFG